MTPLVRVLLITGSTRRASSNRAALRTAIAVSPDWIETRLLDDLAGLPAFNPEDDHDPLPPAMTGLREQISWAAGVLICTPEHPGTLPGSFENLLDWTVGGGQFRSGEVDILEALSRHVDGAVRGRKTRETASP